MSLTYSLPGVGGGGGDVVYLVWPKAPEMGDGVESIDRMHIESSGSYQQKNMFTTNTSDECTLYSTFTERVLWKYRSSSKYPTHVKIYSVRSFTILCSPYRYCIICILYTAQCRNILSVYKLLFFLSLQHVVFMYPFSVLSYSLDMEFLNGFFSRGFWS